MKIYINNRNYLTWPKAMADKLASQGHEAIIIDNASTYPPLLEWYEDCNYSVRKLSANVGHLAPWVAALVDPSEDYVVTDPDLDISDIPDNWDEVLKEGLERFIRCSKAGFSLDDMFVPQENPAYIDDRMGEFPNGNPIVWGDVAEEYKDRIWHKFPIDTTFALYRAGTTVHTIDGVRSGRPYTAKHLPWHLVTKVIPDSPALQIPMNDEIYYYFDTASSASVTKGRLIELMAKYFLLNQPSKRRP